MILCVHINVCGQLHKCVREIKIKPQQQQRAMSRPDGNIL